MMQRAVRLSVRSGRAALLQLLLGVFSLFAQPVIHHVPPTAVRAGEDVPLQFSLTGYIGRVVMAKAYFRAEGEAAYRSMDLASQPPGWQGVLPGRFVRGGSLSYFISVLLDNQHILTWPAVNPYNNPHTLAVSKPAGAPTAGARPAERITPPPQPARTEPPAVTAGVADTLILLSPDQGGRYAPGEVTLAVSYYAVNSRLNPATVRLILDGRDITASAEISEMLITCTPAGLAPGPHTAIVKAQTSGNRTLPPLQIRFTVAGGSEAEASRPRPSFQGHAWLEGIQEAFAGRSDGIAMAGTDFTGKLSSFTYRGMLYLTSLESRHYQPRDRFGFTIGSRLIGVSLGDSYPRLHELILAGRRVRGATGYLHLGLINLDLVYGQTQRAVKTRFVRDATGLLTPSIYGVYRQSILGVRPSLGDGRVFQLGMTLAKIRDDTTSIKAGNHPQDNLVIGPDVKLALFDSRVLLTGAAAMSFLTQDISTGPATADELQKALNTDAELPLDPADLADWLIINDSTVPLDPVSASSLAWFLDLQISQWGHAVHLGYRSIGGAYTSLANPWLRKDLRGFYLADRFRLLQNKLYLDLGLETSADNFSEQNGNPRTDLRTLNGGLACFPGGPYPQLSINLRDQLRDNHVTETSSDRLAISPVLDTLIIRDEREKVWYRDLILQVNQPFQLLQASHQLGLSYISSRTIDDYEKERAALLASAGLSNRVALVSLASRFSVPFSSLLSYSHNRSEGAAFRGLQYVTLTCSGEYRWLQDRLATFTEWRRVSFRQEIAAGAETASSRSQLRVGLRWNLAAGSTLQGEGQFWFQDPPAGAGDAQTERFFRIRYDRYF